MFPFHPFDESYSAINMTASCSPTQLNFQSREENDILNIFSVQLQNSENILFDESLPQAFSYKYPEDAEEEEREN